MFIIFHYASGADFLIGVSLINWKKKKNWLVEFYLSVQLLKNYHFSCRPYILKFEDLIER